MFGFACCLVRCSRTFFLIDTSSSNATPGSAAPSRPHASAVMTPLMPTGPPSPLTTAGKRIGCPGNNGMSLDLMGTASSVAPSQKPESPTALVAATTPTKSHRKRLSASSSGMPPSPSQTTPRPPPQQQQRQQQQPVPPVLAIPPLPQTQSQQTPTLRSPVLHQQIPNLQAHGRRAYAVIAALFQARTTRQYGRRSNQECGECPPSSTFPSEVQHPRTSKLGQAGPGPSNTIAKLGVPSSLLADLQASRFAQRFDSLAGRRRTSSPVTTPPDLPSAQR